MAAAKDPVSLDAYRRLKAHIATSAFFSRTIRRAVATLAGRQFGGARDLYQACGYPRDLGSDDYLAEYRRGDLAARIVDAYPDATWREPPVVKREGTTEGDEDPFGDAITKLDDEIGLWSAFARLDRLAGLGHYGVLLLGFDGGVPFSEPAKGGDFRLLYVQPCGEAHAQILEWDRDTKSPRYGRPLRYRLTLGPDWQGVGGANHSLTVHWTRVVHIAERPLDDEAIGLPRLERIWNRVMDCQKLLGGSAEIYWQNAAQTRAWKADPEVEWEPDERAEMERQFEELYHGLRRDLRLRGVEPQSLAAAVADPKGHLDAQLDFISGATGIPKRILIGSERGELSSEQDENNWAARIAERRNSYATPRIIRPTIDRLIEFGVLPDPGSYVIEWPDADSLGEEKRATIAKTRAEAVSFYASAPGAELLVPPQEFRRWLGEKEVSEFEPPDEIPFDEEDPDVREQFGRDDGAEAGALDGAQFQAIAGIVESVASGSMPPGTALELIRVGFPAVSETSARAIIDPLVGFRASHPGATPTDLSLAVNHAIRRELGELVANAAPRPLYVRRQVLNGESIVEWAKSQGFEVTVPAESMHVTIAHSRTPVDWLRMGDAYEESLRIPPGGPRVLDAFGEEGEATVLAFSSSALAWRHEEMRRAGASWDWPDYQPHITITYSGSSVPLEDVEPYRGEILLGPEIFEEIEEAWGDRLEES